MFREDHHELRGVSKIVGCMLERITNDRNKKAHIIGCQKQMSLFSFFFGLCIGERLFMITDNLSKTLQNEKMSATAFSGIPTCFIPL